MQQASAVLPVSFDTYQDSRLYLVDAVRAASHAEQAEPLSFTKASGWVSP